MSGQTVHDVIRALQAFGLETPIAPPAPGFVLVCRVTRAPWLDPHGREHRHVALEWLQPPPEAS